MNELALFAGAGGGILGGHLLGWRCVCAVEYNAYARSVLLARQNDGTLPPFPVWDDVRTFDGRPWRGAVDVVSGGFPCQDISAAAGHRASGIDGKRSGLWGEMARIVGEVRPRYVYVENSPVLTSRGLGRVLGDLASLGFDAQWGVLGAADVGAEHERNRIWIVAHAISLGYGQPKGQPDAPRNSHRFAQACWSGRDHESGATEPSREIPDAECFRLEQVEQPIGGRAPGEGPAGPIGAPARGGWPAEPDVGRMADGVAARVDRLKALGNGQVPRVAATAWRVLTQA